MIDYEFLSIIGGALLAGYLLSLAHIRTYKKIIRDLQDALASRERLLAERAKDERDTIKALLQKLEVYTKEQSRGSAGYVDRSKKRVAELTAKRRLVQDNEEQWNNAVEQNA